MKVQIYVSTSTSTSTSTHPGPFPPPLGPALCPIVSRDQDFVVTISIKRRRPRSSQPLSSLRLPDPSAAFGTRLPWLPSPRGVFDEPGHTETDEIESILSDLLPDGDLDLDCRCSEPLPVKAATDIRRWTPAHCAALLRRVRMLPVRQGEH